MLHSIQDAWRHSLAALTLFSLIGSVVAVARADTAPAGVGVVATGDDKGGEKIAGQEDKGKKSAKSPDTADELRERVKQLEAENAKLREALAQQKKGSSTHVSDEHSKKPTPKPHDGEAKKGADGTAELEQRLRALHDEIAKLHNAGKAEQAEKLAREAAELKERSTKHAEAKDSGKKGSSPEAREKLEVVVREFEKRGSSPVPMRILRVPEGEGKVVELKLGSGQETRVLHQSSDDLGRTLKELREEVSRLRDEVAELRRTVKEREPAPKKSVPKK